MEASVKAMYVGGQAHGGQVGLPKLSIVTPSFNQAEFLERTLLSVLNQGYPNLEYAVIDGGSRDGSVAIIERYADRLSYWVTERDRGQAHAVNKGLSQVTGEWVAFQNSDDIYLPGALNAIGEAIKATPDAVIVTGHIVHIDGADNITDVQLVNSEATLADQLAVGIQYHNQATFWKRSVLEALGALREDLRFCLDFELFTRHLAEGYRPHVVQRYLGGFRSHAEAKSSTLLDVAKREHASIVAEYVHGKVRGMSLRRYWSRFKRAARFMMAGQGWYLFRKRRAKL